MNTIMPTEATPRDVPSDGVVPFNCPDWCEDRGRGEHADSDITAEFGENDTLQIVVDHGGPKFGPFSLQAQVGVTLDSCLPMVCVDEVLVLRELGGSGATDDPAVLRKLAADALAAAEWMEAHR